MSKTIAVISAHTPSLRWFRIDMMEKFVSDGYRVVAIGNEPEEKWSEFFISRKIEYIQVEIQRNSINPLNDIRYYNALRDILRLKNIETVFLYQAKPIIYGTLAAKKENISDIFSLVAGLGSIYRGDGLKNKILKSVITLQYKIALRHNKSVLFHNNDDKNEFVKSGLTKNENSVVVNGSGVNMTKFPKTVVPKKPSFLYVGRLIKDKGITEYLEAAKMMKELYPSTTFSVVGPFDSNPSAITKTYLDTFIESGIIQYHGESDDVLTHIQSHQVFVLPSYHEGLPKSVIEAMSVGRPIITTNTVGCRDTVEDGLNGLLVEVGSTEQLFNAMTKLNGDLSILQNMGDLSNKICAEKFDVEIINSKILSIIKGRI